MTIAPSLLRAIKSRGPRQEVEVNSIAKKPSVWFTEKGTPFDLDWTHTYFLDDSKVYHVVHSEDGMPWRGSVVEGEHETDLWRIASHKDGFTRMEGLERASDDEVRKVVSQMVRYSNLSPRQLPVEKVAQIQREVYAPMRHEKLIAPAGDKVPYVSYQLSTGCQRGCGWCPERLSYQQDSLEQTLARIKSINDTVEQAYGAKNSVRIRFADTSNWTSVFGTLAKESQSEAGLQIARAIRNGDSRARILTFIDTQITEAYHNRNAQGLEDHLRQIDIYAIGTEVFHDNVGKYVIGKHEDARKKIELTKRLKANGKQVWWTAFTGAIGAAVDIYNQAEKIESVTRDEVDACYLDAVREAQPDAILITQYQSTSGDVSQSARQAISSGKQLSIDEMRAVGRIRAPEGFDIEAKRHHDELAIQLRTQGIHVFTNYQRTIIDGERKPVTLEAFSIL